MKKKLVSLVLCMALLSSLTVCASAEFSGTDSNNLSKILDAVTTNANTTLKRYVVDIYRQLSLTSDAGSTTLRGVISSINDRVDGISTTNRNIVSFYNAYRVLCRSRCRSH